MDKSRTYQELEASFRRHYSAAQEARERKDYYNLVTHLRQAAQCQLDMLECCPPDQKGVILERGRDLMEKAKAFEGLHPECFGNTNRSGESRDGAPQFEVVEKTNTSFNDVVGCEDIKEYVRKDLVKRFMERYRVVFSEGRGGKPGRGMLLFGLPGTGKTMIGRAMATELGCPFLYVRASDLKSRYYGQTEENVQRLYEEAAGHCKNGGCTVLFIDEAETLLADRSGNLQSFEASAVNQFLAVMDGFEKEKMKNVITVICTNYPDKLDAAVLRPGRLGRWFRVDLPDRTLRRKLIRQQFAKGYTVDRDALDLAVEKTRGYNGSDVVDLCDRIKLTLSGNGMDAVDQGKSEQEVIGISSHVNRDTVKAILKTTNSSVSQRSVEELARFEKNYNFSSPNGSVTEFMQNLT